MLISVMLFEISKRLRLVSSLSSCGYSWWWGKVTHRVNLPYDDRGVFGPRGQLGAVVGELTEPDFIAVLGQDLLGVAGELFPGDHSQRTLEPNLCSSILTTMTCICSVATQSEFQDLSHFTLLWVSEVAQITQWIACSLLKEVDMTSSIRLNHNNDKFRFQGYSQILLPK